MLGTNKSIEELSQLMPTTNKEKVGIVVLKKTLVKLKSYWKWKQMERTEEGMHSREDARNQQASCKTPREKEGRGETQG